MVAEMEKNASGGLNDDLLSNKLRAQRESHFPKKSCEKDGVTQRSKCSVFLRRRVILESFYAVPPDGEEAHSFQTDNVSKIPLKIAGCRMFVKIFLLLGRDDPK
jgi:hypothetical protein